MTASYQALMQQLRQAFPQPVSDRVHDSYFVFSFLRALDQLDAMKSETPLLGGPVTLDYDAAKAQRIADEPQSLEAVTATLVQHLAGMFIWGHPKSQINVIPPPTIPSVIGGLLPSIYNPNLVSEESSRQVAVAEVEVSAMTAALVGYDPAQAAGLFTFGGTATILYGVKLGLEKACPGTRQNGVRQPAVILCSERAHYACLAVANWLGLGQENVIQIPCGPENEIRPCLLETVARDVLKEGRPIAAIVATMGTTDHFGLDDLHALHAIRDNLVDEFHLEYVPHLHADAVIGWAWSVFNDYDFSANPLGFRHRTVRALAGTKRRIQHLGLADSIGIDFHKTGFTPYTSSLFLAKNAHDLELISRKQSETPYLFHDGHYHPGRYTLETTRSGAGAMAALANLRLFGKHGFRSLLGHVVTMAETLREHLEGHEATTVVNRGNFGPVTLFRVYPDGVDTFSILDREQHDPSFVEQLRVHNDYNRRIFQIVQHEEASIDAVLESLWAARAQIASESQMNLQ